jgi:hypothetical protein
LTILGTGSLATKADNVRSGTVTFDVRGTKPVTLDLVTTDAEGRLIGRLIIGNDRCELSYHIPMLDGHEPPSWHGYIHVEGYEMRVSIDPKTWVVTLWDERQRVPYRAEAAA